MGFDKKIDHSAAEQTLAAPQHVHLKAVNVDFNEASAGLAFANLVERHINVLRPNGAPMHREPRVIRKAIKLSVSRKRVRSGWVGLGRDYYRHR
jgi:hypothetical protein